MQSVWFTPAVGVVGTLSTWIFMVAELAAHTPLLIVHFNTLFPPVIPVAELAARLGVTSTAVPEKTDQRPEPTVGVLPLKTVLGELMHSV